MLVYRVSLNRFFVIKTSRRKIAMTHNNEGHGSNNKEEKVVNMQGEALSNEEQFNLFLGKSTAITQKVELKRFAGVTFELQPIDGTTMDQIQERATYYTKAKRNESPRKRTDEQLIQAGIIAHGVKTPDLQSKALQEKYNEPTAIDAIKRHFLSGELIHLTGEIMALSGFNDDEDFEVEVKKP